MSRNIAEFEFVKTQACRDPRVNNCPEVAMNRPGVVAFRDSERPGTIVTMTPEAWAGFVSAVKAGEYDLT